MHNYVTNKMKTTKIKPPHIFKQTMHYYKSVKKCTLDKMKYQTQTICP